MVRLASMCWLAALMCPDRCYLAPVHDPKRLLETVGRPPPRADGQAKKRCLLGRAAARNPKKRCLPTRSLFS